MFGRRLFFDVLREISCQTFGRKATFCRVIAHVYSIINQVSVRENLSLSVGFYYNGVEIISFKGELSKETKAWK